MTVPTISSISPASGPASGFNLIEIYGTNFKIPVATYEIPVPVIPATVSVTIGGRPAEHIDVCSSMHIRVQAPRYMGDSQAESHTAVDVVVSNLSSTGVVIPGETATATAVYTYARHPRYAPGKADPLEQVLEAFLERLQREVLLETNVALSIEFNDEGETVTKVEQVPYLGVDLSWAHDKEYSEEDNGLEEVPNATGGYDYYRGQRTYMMTCTLTAGGRGMIEPLALCQAVQEAVNADPYLTSTVDQDLYPGSTDANSYPIEITQDPTQAGRESSMGISLCQMALRVRGIRTVGNYPVEKVKLIEHAQLYVGRVPPTL